MRRELGKFETAAALSGEYAIWNIVGVVLLDRVPAPEILRRVLDILQDRHPLLKVRLIIAGGKHYFESGNIPTIPLEIIHRGSHKQWIENAEDALNHKFDHLTGPLIKCTVIRQEAGAGEIILAAQHAIVDGVSIENLFDELLELSVKIEFWQRTWWIRTFRAAAPHGEIFSGRVPGMGIEA